MLNERLKRYLEPPDKESNRRVLYLTGLAGSGKTTIANILQKDLGGILIPEFLDPIPDYVMDTRVDSGFNQQVRAQQWVLRQYAQKNTLVGRKEGNIIVDRTWIDALIYSRIYGDVVLETIVKKAERYDWELGFYVLLYADTEVVKKRLKKKFGLTESDWQNSWEPYVYELREAVLEIVINSGTFAIDTSSIDPKNAALFIEDKFVRNSL